MTLHDILLSNTSFIFEKNIFYQKEFLKDTFEKRYIDLRQREHRVYSDDVVQNLPEFNEPGPLKNEWSVRKMSLRRLIRRFKKKQHKLLILELGCGNGWLSHQLASSLNAEVLGLDINEAELLQGATLFRDNKNLSFMCADVFTTAFKNETFDVILLASSLQYFPNIEQLICRLLELLNPWGEIHIVDSPIYNSWIESQEAKKRSNDHFSLQGVPEMANNYFHHTLAELANFSPQILSKPKFLISLFKRKILRTPQSPFPWILVKHS
jgi:2-polyprenyl-3-methyl-5-hydroxy-6-metoxy-1,4-benzoquinol methylase